MWSTAAGMIEGMHPLDWEVLNSDQKYEFCDSLLQQMKRRSLLLIVENRNLKNKIKNMENEMGRFREALRAEECKSNQLNEKLEEKMKERQQLRAKEEELSKNVKLLQSQLENEQSERKILEEKIDMASPRNTSLKEAINQRFTGVMDRLRRRLGRRRNSVQDKKCSS